MEPANHQLHGGAVNGQTGAFSVQVQTTASFLSRKSHAELGVDLEAP